jgi:hypothetical protein
MRPPTEYDDGLGNQIVAWNPRPPSAHRGALVSAFEGYAGKNYGASLTELPSRLFA